MARNWDIYTRQGLDAAHAASSLGFYLAKASTRFGFSIARGIATTAVGVTSFAVDQTIFRGNTVASPVLCGAVSTALSIAEQITLAPIYIGESITSTSLIAAHSSINVLSAIFPGSSDASFSLVAFIDLVRREWTQLPNTLGMTNQYGITQIGKAIVGWVALQGVTQEWQEKRWFRYLREVDVQDAPKETHNRYQRPSRVRVTSDVIFPGEGGPQIITADIGEVLSEPERIELRRTRSRPYMRHAPSFSSLPDLPEEQMPIAEVKATLRRLSKLVLAGYGGASLLFFGVGRGETTPSASSSSSSQSSPNTLQHEKKAEEATLANAVGASEAEAAGEPSSVDGAGPSSATSNIFQQYSWWDILLGKHDKDIFESALAHNEPQTAKEQLNKLKNKMKARAVIGDEHLMPRFWVLTDYSREQIVLVIRGTMSLNEIAADLTCDPEEFQPASTPPTDEDDEQKVPGKFPFPSSSKPVPFPSSSSSKPTPDKTYHVHGGMLRMAKLMGDIGKPVQLAVMEALYANPDFELVLCGHSLGAGVAALLGLIWADPNTCLTVPASGLPVGRRVYVYCFAPPALVDASLSRLASKMIVSFVYSHDVVSRLSLGSVRDIRTAAMWLCEAEASKDDEGKNGKNGGEGYTAVTRRARQYKAGWESDAEMQWFIAVRKSLEANMQHSDMFPPGRVLWAMRENDLHPAHRRSGTSSSSSSLDRDSKLPAQDNKLRLFEVLNVAKVFSQVVFAQDMLTAHMPHQYDKVLHDLI